MTTHLPDSEINFSLLSFATFYSIPNDYITTMASNKPDVNLGSTRLSPQYFTDDLATAGKKRDKSFRFQNDIDCRHLHGDSPIFNDASGNKRHHLLVHTWLEESIEVELRSG